MLVINILGLLLIILIAWWFWFYKPEEASAEEGVINITVENGVYQPSHIRVTVGEPVTLSFLRKDASPCAATVVFDDFDISQELPLNKATNISLLPNVPGNYAFTCQMQMYRGELVVEDKK